MSTRRAQKRGALHFPELALEQGSSPLAEQLRRGFAGLRFGAPLEREFRDFYVAQNLPRTKFAGLIALVVVLAVACIDLMFGERRTDAIDLVRLTLLAPLIAVLTTVVLLPALRPWYMPLTAVSIGLIGLVVTYVAHAAALAGDSYVLVGLVVVILYGCFFVGLLFRFAVGLAAAMIAAHVTAGSLFGLPLLEVLHTTAVLVGAALIGGMSTYSLEHSLRTNFLETGLLNELAERDGLTGLYNRRIFDDRVERLWRHARRERMALGVVFIDIDYFKIFNDLYGHQAGDDCLRRVAQCVARGAQRPLDLAARYGGEEFMLALCGTSEEHLRTVAEQIRGEVLALAIAHAGSAVARHVTVSVGLALVDSDGERSLAGAIQLADEALYAAKRDGRNGIRFRNAADSAMETGRFRIIQGDSQR